jgi:hypothetical protein
MSKEVKHVKIVDTINSYGAAENYIKFNADFERFLKSTYGRADLLNIDPVGIVKKYHLKGIAFGNYVTQEERYHFLYKISKQLEALAKVKGSNNLGKDVLVIAFGSQGMPKANAHFNAKDNLINLNRGRKENKKYKDVLKGENSFIHEYAHFLDHQQALNDSNIPTWYSCERRENGITGDAKTRAFVDVVNKAEDNDKYIARLQGRLNTKYLESRIEVFARLFETAFTYYVYDKYSSFRSVLDVKKYGAEIYLTKDEIKKGRYETAVINILKGKGVTKKESQKILPTKAETREQLLKKFPIVLEWSEGIAEENKGYKTLEALEKDLKKAGFTDKPTKTYVKNKIWLRNYPTYIRIDNGKAGGDYNYTTTKVKDYLEDNYSVVSNGKKYNFSTFQFGATPKAKKSDNRGQLKLLDRY